MYSVKDWNEHYEKAQSRKVDVAQWVPLPVKHDGKGYRRLMALPNGLRILGAWTLILQVAAKCKPRGILADNEGPLTAEDIALKTGAPEEALSEALEVLTGERIGWLVVAEYQRDGSQLVPTEEDITVQGKTGQDKEDARGKPPRGQQQCDDDYLADLQKREAYNVLNVRFVYSKMVAWCEQKHKQPTRGRLLNWLNREERPMGAVNESSRGNTSRDGAADRGGVKKPVPAVSS